MHREDLLDVILAAPPFPGMWDWERSMVERLALAALPRCLPVESHELEEHGPRRVTAALDSTALDLPRTLRRRARPVP